MCCNRMGCLVAGLQRLQCLQELIRRNPIQSRHPQWTATIFSRAYERTDFAPRHFANVFEAKQMVFLNQHHCCFVSAEDISRERFRSHREQS